MSDWSIKVEKQINEKITRISEEIGAQFPHATTKDGKYLMEEPKWWTAGFWPGILWQVYQQTENPRLKKLAQSCEKQLSEVLRDPRDVDHDAGFMWTLSSVYQNELVHDSESEKHSLLAANLLAARFNIKGEYLRAWNPWTVGEDNSGIVIIDSLMNLSLLFRASEASKDPRFKHIAIAHADTILKEFVRMDGSVYQTVLFDSETGKVLDKLGGQGFSKESAWSRGCAWAIYGFAIVYRYTKEPRFLTASKKVGRFFIEQLGEQAIALWDFKLPANTSERKYDYPDASANAIAACGLLELSSLCEEEKEKKAYFNKAEEMLHSLTQAAGEFEDSSYQGLIKHASGHFPANKNLDVSLIYGDYFFVEAIHTLNNHQKLQW